MSHFLLLHGFLGQPGQWRRLQDELEGRGHTTRALALPRGSWADEIALVHRELVSDPRPTVLVGHSMGGSLVRAVATVHPGSAFGLGTIAAPPVDYHPVGWPDDLFVRGDDGVIRPAEVQRWLDFAFPGAPPEFTDLHWEQPRMSGREPFGDLPGSEPRVAILAEDDALVPAGDQERMAASMAAPTAWVPGGHSPHVRHPELVATLLINWLTPQEP